MHGVSDHVVSLGGGGVILGNLFWYHKWGGLGGEVNNGSEVYMGIMFCQSVLKTSVLRRE